MSWEGSFLSNPFLQDSGKSVMVQTQDGFLPLTQGSRLFLFSLPASSVFHSYLEVTRFLIFSPCIRVLVLLWRRIQVRLSPPLAVAGISSSNLPMRVLSYFFLYPEFSSWESCEDIWRRAHKLPLCPWLLCVSYSYVNTHLALGNLLKLLAEFISPILLFVAPFSFYPLTQVSWSPQPVSPRRHLSFLRFQTSWLTCNLSALMDSRKGTFVDYWLLLLLSLLV